jgi:hypothetical protein
MRHVSPLLLLLLLLTGCDPVYGISRSACVPLMPPPDSVASAIRDTPGVDQVEYRFSEEGEPLTLTGIKAPDQVHTFSYRGGSNVRGSLQFTVDYRGTVEYSQSLMMMGRHPPQEWIDATRPVMLKIEQRLERDCGLKGLSDAVVERCIGVKCK